MSLTGWEMMLRTSSRRSYIVLGLHGAGGVNERFGDSGGGQRESEREDRGGPKKVSPFCSLLMSLSEIPSASNTSRYVVLEKPNEESQNLSHCPHSHRNRRRGHPSVTSLVLTYQHHG